MKPRRLIPLSENQQFRRGLAILGGDHHVIHPVGKRLTLVIGHFERDPAQWNRPIALGLDQHEPIRENLHRHGRHSREVLGQHLDGIPVRGIGGQDRGRAS